MYVCVCVCMCVCGEMCVSAGARPFCGLESLHILSLALSLSRARALSLPPSLPPSLSRSRTGELDAPISLQQQHQEPAGPPASAGPPHPLPRPQPPWARPQVCSQKSPVKEADATENRPAGMPVLSSAALSTCILLTSLCVCVCVCARARVCMCVSARRP